MIYFIIISILFLVLLLTFNKNTNRFKNITSINNGNDIPIYFINLDRSTDRYKNIVQNANINNIQHFIKFKGIDGSRYKLTHFDKKLFEKSNFQLSSYGVIGCALSHYNLWKYISRKKHNISVICEDDIIFSSKFTKTINYLINNKMSNYDIIFLSNSDKIDDKIIDNSVIKYDRRHWFGAGATCYLINLKAIKHLINTANVYGFDTAVDWFIYNQYDKIKIGYLKCPIAEHTGTQSVIQKLNASD